MSTATDRVVTLLNARRIRDNEFKARCPSHQGKSTTSLSIKDAGDRVLLHCHNGCTIRSVLDAIKLSAAELFDSVRTPPSPAAVLQSQAERGLEFWSQQRLTIVCECLLEMDFNIGLSTSSLALYQDNKVPRNPEEEQKLWDVLGDAIQVRETLEREFEILNSRSLVQKLELWRHYRAR